MEFKLLELLVKQQQLDELILASIEITKVDLLLNRFVAFNVEVGEFANELRTFKHWSKKPSSPASVCLEEYVDALHFLLSITYSIGVNADDYLAIHQGADVFDVAGYKDSMEHIGMKTSINSLIMGLYSTASELYYLILEDSEPERKSDLIVDLWHIFLLLGHACDFTIESITNAYDGKYEVNIKRQAEGY